MNKHTKAEDLNFLKIQTCVLKVSIHCEGCKKKVKKLLQKIDGVYTIEIDAEHGKVTVNGNMNPSTLIKKLSKAGKHAELWPAKKNGGGGGGFELGRQLPSLAGYTAKGEQKPLNGSEGKDQKLQLLQKDMKIPLGKDEKSVKFPAIDKEFEDGSEFDDEFDAEEDDFDDTDDSAGDSDDDESVLKAMTAAPKNIAAAKQITVGGGGGGGGGGGVKSKNNGSNNSGAGQGAGGKSDLKCHGLEGVPTAGGLVSKGAAAAAATPISGGHGGAYQQQHVAEMMQQQRMMMMTNGYPMAYGYPMPRSESYTDYFSDENTGGGCGIM